MSITKRQARILAAIVREYAQKCRPVGSEDLVHKYRFDVSPATIRNEMKALEDEGLITQPHTSAGRIPTDDGYRYFINKLMKHLELTNREQRRLQQELRRLQRQYVELGRSLTKLLAEQTQGAAFALLPDSISTTGLPNVIEKDSTPEEIREVARFLDEVADHKEQLLHRATEEVEAFVGTESPVPLAGDFSLVVTPVRLPSGKRGVVGIVGPKRMEYAKNMSLLEYISKFLSSGLGIYIVLINF